MTTCYATTKQPLKERLRRWTVALQLGGAKPASLHNPLRDELGHT